MWDLLEPFFDALADVFFYSGCWRLGICLGASAAVVWLVNASISSCPVCWLIGVPVVVLGVVGGIWWEVRST